MFWFIAGALAALYIGYIVAAHKAQPRKFVARLAEFLEHTGYQVRGHEGTDVRTQAQTALAPFQAHDKQAASHVAKAFDAKIELGRHIGGHDVRLHIRLGSDEQRLTWTADVQGPQALAFAVSPVKAVADFDYQTKTGHKKFDKRFTVHSNTPNLAVSFLTSRPQLMEQLLAFPSARLLVQDNRVYLIDSAQEAHRRVAGLRQHEASFGFRAFRRTAALADFHRDTAQWVAWLANEVAETDPAKRFVIALSFPYLDGAEGAYWSDREAFERLRDIWGVRNREEAQARLSRMLRTESEDPRRVAWGVALSVHLTRISEAAGLLSREEAWAYLRGAGSRVAEVCSDWHQFADAYLFGFAEYAREQNDRPENVASWQAEKRRLVDDLLMGTWSSIQWGALA